MKTWGVGDKIYVGWICFGKIYVWRDEVSSYGYDGSIGLVFGGYGPWELRLVDEHTDDVFVSDKRRHVYEWAIEANNHCVDKISANLKTLNEALENSGV